MRNNEGFPRRLQRLRESRGMSRRILSELCGLSTNLIAVYERGECDPTATSLIAIADYFGVTVDYLLCRETRTEKTE